MLLIPIESLRYESDCLRKAREAYLTVVYYLYSSIYSVYSRFFLINLMTTGIGQSKHCIPQPFSRCLISLCSSLFYFNCIFNFRLIAIMFDPTLSYIDRYGFAVVFSSLSLHYNLFPRGQKISNPRFTQ